MLFLRRPLAIYWRALGLIGHVRTWDRLVVRGDREVGQPRFVAWYLQRSVPRAALIVNHGDAEDPVREIIRRNRPVDPDRLADQDVDLADLSAGA